MKSQQNMQILPIHNIRTEILKGKGRGALQV